MPTDPDRHSVARRLFSLVHQEVVTPFVRWVCLALSFVMTQLAWDPLFNPDNPAYDRPQFEGVTHFASLPAWGVGFATAAILMLLAAISGRAVIYLLAITVAAVTQAGWSSMVIYESWSNPGAVLTSGVLGYYVGTFTAIVGLAMSPRQLAVEKPLEIVTADNEVIPLRRTGS